MKRITFTVYGTFGKTKTVTGYRIPQTPEHQGMQLVAHKSLSGDVFRGAWTVAEETTSAAVGRGPTRAAAIDRAVEVLATKTPEQIESAFRAMRKRAAGFKAESRIELLDSVTTA